VAFADSLQLIRTGL